MGARRREAGAARPPLLPQPGPIARPPASRGAWHTLPLPPRVSPHGTPSWCRGGHWQTYLHSLEFEVYGSEQSLC